MKDRITPENIQRLSKDQILIFGANESGFHGAGLALHAKLSFGAKQGVGFGPTGKCFAIPTKDWEVGHLQLEEIAFYVQRFIAYAIKHPDKTFLVTAIGCGLASWEPEHIAPLFESAYYIKNIHLPQRFWDVLNKK